METFSHSEAEHVLKYLARYITGGPIANSRLIANEAGQVSFWARSTDKSKKGERVNVSYSGVEFVRRWSLHILPKGFTRSRFFGGWSNTRRKAYSRACDELSPVPMRVQEPTTKLLAVEEAPSAHTESPQSKTEDKSKGLDIGHNQAIRTDTIDRTGDQHLAGKHAASMLRMLLYVC